MAGSRILLYGNEPINICSDQDPNVTCTPQGGCNNPQLFLQVPPNPQPDQVLMYQNGSLIWSTVLVEIDYNNSVGF